MLQNSGAFGPSDGSVNVNAASNFPQIPVAPKLDDTSSKFGGIGPDHLRTLGGGYDLSTHGNFPHESGSLAHHLGTFPPYFNRNFADYYGSINSSNHETNWPNSVQPMPKEVPADPVPNVPNFMSPFHNPMNKSTEVRETTPITSNWSGGMDNYDLFNKNSDRFSNFSESFNPTPVKNHILDNSKRKSIENTVKIIENMISNSTFERETVQNMTNGEMETSNDDLAKSSTINENTTEEDINDTAESLTNSTHKKPKKSKEPKAKKPKKEKKKAEKKVKKEKKIDKVKKTKGKEVVTAEEVTSNDTSNTSVWAARPTDPLATSIKLFKSAADNKTTNNEESEKEDTANNKEKEVSEEVDESLCTKTENEDEEDIEDYVEDAEEDKTEYITVFQKDTSIVPKDEVDKERVVNIDSSVSEADDYIKNGISTEGYFECLFCNSFFKHPKRFLIHVKWHTFGLTNEIRNQMAKQRLFQKHQKREAKFLEKEGKGEAFRCKDCNKLFVSKGSLRGHRAKYHTHNARKCLICNEEFVGLPALTAHMSTQHVGPLACPTCHKMYTSRYTLAKHMDSHKAKLHACQECGKLFGSPAQLGAHRRIHVRAERGATYRCSYCGKGFFETYNLQIHERTHTNEKPFACEKCNTSYVSSGSLKRHFKRTHNNASPFECSLCGRGFQSQTTLAVHMEKLHSAAPPPPPASPPHPNKIKSKKKSTKDPLQNVETCYETDPLHPDE